MLLKRPSTIHLFHIILIVFCVSADRVFAEKWWLTNTTGNQTEANDNDLPKKHAEAQQLSAHWWREKVNPWGPPPTPQTQANITNRNDANELEPIDNFTIPPGVFTMPPDGEGFTNPPGILESGEERQEDCMCVPFYQCDETGTIKTDGAGILEIRHRIQNTQNIYNVDVCPEEDPNIPMKCCKLPPGATVPPSSYVMKPPAASTELPTSAATPLPTPIQKPCGTRIGYDVAAAWLRLTSPDDTSFGEFPWMLALLGPDEKAIVDEQHPLVGNIFQCGASLIHPQVAITAAHCIKNRSSVNYIIRAGEYDTSGLVEALPHQDRHVVEILIPDNYNPRSLYHDLALLILDQPINTADNVGTICLPEIGDTFDNELCVATGWGRSTLDHSSEYNGVLKKVDLSVVPSQQCQQQLRTTRLGIFFILDPSFVCAKGQRKQDTCSGDGGGPLACPSIDDKNHYALTGIVAWGIGCGDQTPGVYASISTERLWIDQQMSVRGFAANEPL